tara:strand:- start:1284 stop:1622 length:339 start_codon:yes stop_codon:yes gene_type:complete
METGTSVPPWFWKIVTTCTLGGTVTLVTTGWSLGAFISETQTWQRAQDERFAQHLEDSNQIHRDMISTVTTIRDTVNNNGKYGAAFKARMDAIDRRLNRLEDQGKFAGLTGD